MVKTTLWATDLSSGEYEKTGFGQDSFSTGEMQYLHYFASELTLMNELFKKHSHDTNKHLQGFTHPGSGWSESFGSRYPWVAEEEGALLSPVCLEGEAVYRNVQVEGAPGLADR